MTCARWVLSCGGGKLWDSSNSDIFIVDPGHKVNFKHLVHHLGEGGHGWSKEDIVLACSSSDITPREKKIVLTHSQERLPKGGTVVTFVEKIEGVQRQVVIGSTMTRYVLGFQSLWPLDGFLF